MFFTKKTADTALVLDLESSIARGSLYRRGTAEALFRAEVKIPFKPDSGSVKLTNDALKAVASVVEAVLREISVRVSANDPDYRAIKVNTVHFILSSPWLITKAKTLSQTFAKDTVLSAGKMAEILENERSELVRNSDRLEVVEEKVLDIRLNGYEVPVWIGRQTRDIEIALCTSLMGARLADRLRGACSRVVPAHRVQFHSSILLEQIGLRIAMPDRTDYSLLVVHGELTDAAMIARQSGVLLGSFPIGSNTVIRSIAQAMKTDIETAESTISLFESGSLDLSHGNSTKTAIDSAMDAWVASLSSVIRSAELVPSIFLLSVYEHRGFFSAAIQRSFPDVPIEGVTSDTLAVALQRIIFA